MCGLAGWIRVENCAPAQSQALAEELLSKIKIRGPDARGITIRNDGQIGLVHTRLAIIDIDNRSNQPMVDLATSVAISFNGEIYNYKILRSALQLEGEIFDTAGDTEVIIRGYLRHGIEFFSRLRGMYAFGIHDPRSGEVIALRDPLGIKPLYASVDNEAVFFGSSPRAIAEARGGLTGDPAAAVSVALLGCVLDPLSAFQGVGMLGPGVLHRWKICDGRISEIQLQINPVWERQDELPGDSWALEVALSESVAAHFESDVPIAVFQSGGLDSKIITALAVRAGYRPHLITLVFEDFVDTDKDEGSAVASFAHQLGLEHTVVRLSETDFLLSVDKILHDMESPTIDGINTYLLAKACRELGFKVAISGLGGDELFAGYLSFSRIPALARFVSALGHRVPLRFLGALGAWSAKISHLPPKLVHASNYLSGMRDLYLLQRGIFLKEEATTVLSPYVLDEGLPKFMLAFNALTEGDAAPEPETVRRFERSVYMRNMLLKDADWAGMAHGVEIRTPLVDIVLERALCDSADRCRYGKADLSKLLGHISNHQSPVGRKVGFSVPYQRWFAGGTARTTPGSAIRAWCKRVLEVKFPGLTTSSESSL